MWRLFKTVNRNIYAWLHSTYSRISVQYMHLHKKGEHPYIESNKKQHS